MSIVEITKESQEELLSLIESQNKDALVPILEKLYAADIAELFNELNLDQAV